MRTSQKTNRQAKKSPQKKKAFTKYMQEKLAITVLVITLALFALIYVLYDIVNANQDQYNQIVLNQQEYDSRVIPYRRGDIVDRNGTVMATTDRVYNLIIDPKQIVSETNEHLEPTVSALSSAFGYDPGEMRTLITENAEKMYIRYARQLPAEDKDNFEAIKTQINTTNSEANVKGRVRGIWFEDEYKRIYPNNSVAAHVIGFASSDGTAGNNGIEQYYNSTLVGTNGREYGYLNDESNLERVLKPATNGNTVVSTIDFNIQTKVEKHIQDWAADPGADRIGVVVMDPRNGEILAMAGDQMFDLNNPRDVSSRFTAEELMELGRQEAMDAHNRKNPDNRIALEQVDANFSREDILSYGQQVAWNQVWRNFAVSDTFEPGSPSKIFTVAAGLEEGVLTGNESFFCDGYQEVGGHRIKCVNRNGHGMLTLEESLMVSCNDAMMQIAAMEGRDRFAKYQQLFGFGSRTGIDLPGEADTSRLIYTEENMKPSDLATNAFGQSFNCTMVQMAAAYASVINGGSYYEPHVVRQILNDQGSIVEKPEPVLVRETVSESTSNYIKQALLRTVNEGTGGSAAVIGYDIAGKTGTAERLPRGTNDYLVSFCGFAPAMDPEVLVYVVIDIPHVANQAQSSLAGGLFQKIMADILPYLNIFPDMDAEDIPEDIAALLPEEEGISDSEGEIVPPEETQKVYERDEIITPAEGEEEGDGGLPDDMPGTPEPYETNSLRDFTEAAPVNAGSAAGTTRSGTTAAATTGTTDAGTTTTGTTDTPPTTSGTTRSETTAAPTTRAETTPDPPPAASTPEATSEPVFQVESRQE